MGTVKELGSSDEQLTKLAISLLDGLVELIATATLYLDAKRRDIERTKVR